MRPNRVLVALGVLVALVAPPPPAVSAGTGAVTVVREDVAPDVRPGPDILYAGPPDAPQLQATGIWRAATRLVSGASGYAGGEFLYTDYLYDDRGDGSYAYPTAPEYTQNDADLVEVRLREVGDALAVRLTFQSMASPELVGTTIALGSSDSPVAMPHGANTVAPAEVFVTVHGDQAMAVRAADGEEIAGDLDVQVDLDRRQVQVRIPRSVYTPTDPFRVAAATGLWDPESGTYVGRGPDGSGSAFYNAAFRYDEDGDWFAADQGAAIGAGDISPFFADVDLALLRSGIDDALTGTEQGAPTSGYLGRIYASRFEQAQGRGKADVPTGGAAGGGQPTPENCPEACTLAYPNQLQPYGLYLPAGGPPDGGWGLTVDLHGANSAYTAMMFNQRGRQLGDRGLGSVVLYPHERGETNTYYGLAEADTFEAWADVARSYPLDVGRTAVTGGSMGGVGTYKYASEYPDLFAAAAPVVGYPYAWIGYTGPPDGMHTTAAGEYTIFYSALASLRNVPLMIWNSYVDELVPYTAVEPVIELLDDIGYRYAFYGFTLDHFGMGLTSLMNSTAIADFLGDRTVDPDPAHVTYVMDSNFVEPRYGLNPDHAYWVSGITLAAQAEVPDPYGSAATFGHVDVVSHGFGVADAPALPPAQGVGADAAVPHTVLTRDWGEVLPAPVADRLEITVSSVSALTIDVRRARVTCDAQLDVTANGPLEITLAGCGSAPTVERLAGADRIATAVKVSRAAFPGGAPAAVLARADSYADALAGAPLAAELEGPLLLTAGDQLSPEVALELQRLGAEQVVILGGEAAVSATVTESVAGTTWSPAVDRVAGEDRFATAAAIAARLPDTTTGYVVEGIDPDPARGWPDAVAAAALAAYERAPILLVDTDRVPSATAAAVTDLELDQLVVVGGPAAVSHSTLTDLAMLGPTTTRTAGATRYETSALVRDRAVAGGADPREVWLATGRAFPDALAAGPAAAAAGATLLLIDGTDPAGSPATLTAISRDAPITTLVLLGGSAAISEAARDAAVLAGS